MTKIRCVFIIFFLVLICSGIVSAASLQRKFPSDPQAVYTFDEGTAHDTSGKDRDGTVTGATSIAGLKVLGFSFSGVGDQIIIPNINMTDAVSISVWAKMGTTTPSVRHIVSRHPGWYISANPGSSTIRLGIKTTTKEDITFDTWANLGTSNYHHFVGVYDGTNMTTYLDGNLMNTMAKTGNLDMTGESRIGAYRNDDNSYRWIGEIDEVHIFDRALTIDEILRLYYRGKN